MKNTAILTAFGLASLVAGQKPQVSSKALQDAVRIEDLMGHCKQIYDRAMKVGKNRLAGSVGHNTTISYITETLNKGGFWDIQIQPFSATYQREANAKLVIDGVDMDAGIARYSPSGSFEGVEIAKINNHGCDSTDFPADVKGKIALISRGECSFGEKSAMAGAAGAVGAIIYDNEDQEEFEIAFEMESESQRSAYVPTVSLSKQQGLELVQRLQSEAVKADFQADVKLESAGTTYNVIATSKQGDANNQLFVGAHSDSVSAGFGMNDNGSGSCTLLTIAKALEKFTLTNQVRLGWWSAEEAGLVGSTFFVKNANADTLKRIRLYLNFDMVSSPNFIYSVYDGSGRGFGQSGPPGSDKVQDLFEAWFKANGPGSVPTKFDGRSDYGPFLKAKIPCGGLFTGAEGKKTEAHVKMFGGTAGQAFDPNYHKAGDTYENHNKVPFEKDGKAIAHAVGTFAASWNGFPPRSAAARGPALTSVERTHPLADMGITMRGALYE